MTVAELASAVGLSDRDLHRRVREALGTTPHELILRMRIQAAQRLSPRPTYPSSGLQWTTASAIKARSLSSFANAQE
jgi:methylphosphotriester-DNA--protein-cysteine methyltransferase